MNPASLPPGSCIGAWRVVAFVTQGSCGVLYRVERADNPEAGVFALKLALRPEDPHFALEAELLSRVHHPGVPRLHGSGEWTTPSGVRFPFIIMDWVDGLPLYAWGRLQPRSSRQVLRVLAQVARALQAVHEAGGLHRDVKGANVQVRSEDEQALLVDFGSGTWRGAPVPARESELPGTPGYRSPQSQLHEWKFRRRATARYESSQADDLYALGITAYRLVTGGYPRIAEDTDTETDEGLSRFPELVPVEAVVHLSPELARWIRQMLAVPPEDRGTTLELALGLELAAKSAGREADQPIRPRSATEPETPEAPAVSKRQPLPWKRWLSAAAASVALVAGAWQALHGGALLNAARESARRADAAAEAGTTTGLGDNARTPLASASWPSSARGGVSKDVPEDPLPGQRLSPCKRPQVEIHGSCWILVGNETPPCIDSTYEWNKRCYWPAFGPARPPTSGQEQPPHGLSDP